MRKEIRRVSIATLQNEFPSINFPQYQREANIWSRGAKELLIDSIFRSFDISNLYFFKNPDDTLDCIDGRQRLNAIMSYLGRNDSDTQDNGGLVYPGRDETNPNGSVPFQVAKGKTYAGLAKASDGDPEAKEALEHLRDYEMTWIILESTAGDEEYNLQFLRLNLGVRVNAGEKLNAMFGWMRDLCFKPGRLRDHPFWDSLNMPKRRFATEQTIAHVVAQVFTRADGEGPGKGQFARTRHTDLQEFFGRHDRETDEMVRLIDELISTLDGLHRVLATDSPLGNRAITVSTVLLAFEAGVRQGPTLEKFGQFIRSFACRLKWQVKKVRLGFGIDEEYQYLFEFNRHVTQAAVEPYAVRARGERLQAEWERWQSNEVLTGDEEYRIRTGEDPQNECD